MVGEEELNEQFQHYMIKSYDREVKSAIRAHRRSNHLRQGRINLMQCKMSQLGPERRIKTSQLKNGGLRFWCDSSVQRS